MIPQPSQQAEGGICPPECTQSPRQQPSKDASITHRIRRLRGEEHRPADARKRAVEKCLPESLQREAPLAPRPAQDHLLEGVGRRHHDAAPVPPAVEQTREEQCVEEGGEAKSHAKKHVRHHDGGRLQVAAQPGRGTDGPSPCGGRQHRDEGQTSRRRQTGNARRVQLRRRERNGHIGEDGHGDVGPPEAVDGGAPAAVPAGDENHGGHL